MGKYPGVTICHTAGILATTANMKKIHFIAVLSIVLLSLWGLQIFFKPGLFETHDGRLHITKLQWFVEALRQGHIPVRWTETANHQYGYPIFMFYYPLLFYLGSLFVVLGWSLTAAFKILLVSTFILSGLFMYRFLREWFSSLSSWAGAVLYLFAPYRFVSMYVTGRWAESVSFAVIPLVFWTMSKLQKAYTTDKMDRTYTAKWIKFGAVAYALLILSHNVQAMLFTPLILLFMLILIWNSHPLIRKSLTTSYILLTTLALGLSSFFWLPALYELKWTYQGQKPVYDFRENFPSLRSYFYYPWGYGFSLTGTKDGVSPMVGLAQFGAMGLGILGLLGGLGKLGSPSPGTTARRGKFVLLGSLLLASGITFLFMNKISLSLWERIPLLPSIQFPSRLTGVLVFLVPVITALSLHLLHSRWMKISVVSVLVALALYGNRNHLRAGVPDRFTDQDVLSIYQNIFGTGETAGENAPIWSMSLPQPYEPNEKLTMHRRRADLLCLNAWVAASTLKPRDYRASVINNTDRSQSLAVNTVYYPGWRAYVDGSPVSIEPPHVKSENPLGLVRIPVPSGSHEVEVFFGETPLRAGANAASLTSLVLLLVPILPVKKYNHRNNRNEI